MSLSRSKVTLVIVIAILAAVASSAVALRGHFAPTEEFQAFEVATSQLSTIYSFSLSNNISLPTNNFTILSNPQSQNATVKNNRLFGSFSSANTVAITFQEDVNVSAVEYPYFQVSVTTAPDFTPTSGFGFGLRFLARLTDGSTVLLWNGDLPVEHVHSGGTVTLSAYVLNYNPNIDEIIGIRLYAEERAGINSEYSIQVNSIVTSSVNQVPNCSSPVCYIPIAAPTGTGYFDTLVADTVFTGQSDYRIGLSYGGRMFVSRAYSNGSNHVSIIAHSPNATLQGTILASIPVSSPALFIISNSIPMSVHIQNVKLTFTPVPAHAIDFLNTNLPWQTSEALLFAELMLVFALPAELLILRIQWKTALVAGIIMRLMIMPWTAHPADTLTFIRTAYLYYHEGWGPIFYNPPTIFALSIPTGSMQIYYVLGLDQIDKSFLFHYGGVLATFFVKLPFLLADIASVLILSTVSKDKKYAMFYFLNPFSIYISAVWGQYEGVTTLALIAGYTATVKLRPKLASLAGFGGLLLGGLIELFGFFAIPMLATYLVIKRLHMQLVIPVSGTLLALLIPSSLSQYVFSFRPSDRVFQPGLYSFSGSFGVDSQVPLIAAVTAAVILSVYSLTRTSAFFSTLAPVSAAIISFELFAGSQPQFMLIPLGLLTLLFAARNDKEGLVFVWLCGAILAFISIVGTQSFAYLLTGIGYYMIPLIEGGPHLKFYAVGLLIVGVGLLSRAYKKFSFPLISLTVVSAVGLAWFLVNFI